MKLQRTLLIILVPCLILTILWVMSNVYHNYTTSTITDPLTFQIIPIEGKFDNKTIEQIKTRVQVEPLYDISNFIEVIEVPIPTVTIQPGRVIGSSPSAVILQGEQEPEENP